MLALPTRPKAAGKVLLLPIDAIEPSPWQARTVFNETEIAALAVSILQNGLLQPVTVRKAGERYQLIAGERRLRACRLAKMEQIPAIVADYDDRQAAALGLLENLQRQQLDPFDTARGLREVIGLWGCTQAEAARRLGLSQPALANKLRLLLLTEEQQNLCLEANLTERHARAVLRLPAEARTAALKHIGESSMSVRQADAYVERLLVKKPRHRSVPMVRDVRIFLNTLEHAVGLMVQGGVAATSTREEKEGYIEYTVRIPTPQAPKEAGEQQAAEEKPESTPPL